MFLRTWRYLPLTWHSLCCVTTPVPFSLSAGHLYMKREVCEDPASKTMPYYQDRKHCRRMVTETRTLKRTFKRTRLLAQPQVIEVSFRRSSHDPVTGITSSKPGISVWFHKGPTGCRVLFQASSSTAGWSHLINWSVLIQLIDQTVGASLVERQTCSHSVLSEVSSTSKVEVKAARSQTNLVLVNLEKCFLDLNKIDNFVLL